MMLEQCIENLPEEVLSLPRFFPLRAAGSLSAQKAAVPRGWNQRENQHHWNDMECLGSVLGFDITARGEGETDFLVFDFDHVLTDEGQFVCQEAEETFHGLMQSLGGTYAEKSISGHGIHILAMPSRGTLPPMTNSRDKVTYFTDSRDKDAPKLETYYATGAKYFLLTGQCFGCEPGAGVASGSRADAAIRGYVDKLGGLSNQRGGNAAASPVVRQVQDVPADYDLARAAAMLDYIEPAGLDYSEWVLVGAILHDLGADVSLWDAWSQKDSARYKGERETFSKWGSFRRGSGAGIATLHDMAKKGGYSERDFKRQWHERERAEKQERGSITRRLCSGAMQKNPAELTAEELLAVCRENLYDIDPWMEGVTIDPATCEIVSVSEETAELTRQFIRKRQEENIGAIERMAAVPKQNAAMSQARQDVPASGIMTAADYLDGVFDGEAEFYARFRGRKTGFEGLDAVMSFEPGLYVIGGIASVGKTSFCLQWCDQLAERGELCVYVCAEQSKQDLIAKSISRFARRADPSKVQPSMAEIRAGERGGSVLAGREAYRKIADRILLIDTDFDGTIDALCRDIDGMFQAGKNPTVFIDYLQLINPGCDERGKPRDGVQGLEYIMKALKRLQKKWRATMIIISAMNRANGKDSADYSSFRGSSSIEYTANYLLGLEYSCFYDSGFAGLKGLERKKRLDDEDSKNPREVDLQIMKCRESGAKGKRVSFLYYPENDLFTDAPRKNDGVYDFSGLAGKNVSRKKAREIAALLS